MGPALHQPGREERRRPHVRAVPRHAGAVGEPGGGVGERLPPGPPLAEPFADREGPDRGEGELVHPGVAPARGAPEPLLGRGEGVRITDREGGRPVEEREVGDLVGDVPAGAGGPGRPLVVAEFGDDLVECGLLVQEVGENL